MDTLCFVEGLHGIAWSLALAYATTFFLFCGWAFLRDATTGTLHTLARWVLGAASFALIAFYIIASASAPGWSLDRAVHHTSDSAQMLLR